MRLGGEAVVTVGENGWQEVGSDKRGGGSPQAYDDPAPNSDHDG